MPDFTSAQCFGCGATIEEAPGNYYCASCITAQTVAAREEREAFDAYHAFADRIARDAPTLQRKEA